jgi:chorismate dehydratase
VSTQATRIGCVPYLNARPLLEGIGFPVTERVPAQLCDLFAQGMLDAALLSSIDVLTQPEPAVVDGVSISCRGPVRSVLLAYDGELSDLRAVQLDPASHTSNVLARIVLEEFHGFSLEYVHISERKSLEPPAVIIGDPALSVSKRPSQSGVKFLDLGQEWVNHTGLPFVFALWTLRKEFTKKSSLSVALRKAKEHGLGSLTRIASETPDPEFTRSYLGGAIHYDLGEAEKRGLALFADYLIKWNLSEFSPIKIKYY